MINIDDLFTLVKVIGNNDFYLLLPGKVDIDTEDGEKIVKEAVKRKMPHNFGAKDKNEEIHSIGFSSFYETRN